MPLEDNLCFSWTYGIWKSVYLLPLPAAPTPAAAILQLQLQTFYHGEYPMEALTAATQGSFAVHARVHFLTERPCSGTLTLVGEWSGFAGRNSTAVTLPAGESAFNVTVQVPAASYSLWWPNQMGARQLYNVTATFEATIAVGETVILLALPRHLY